MEHDRVSFSGDNVIMLAIMNPGKTVRRTDFDVWGTASEVTTVGYSEILSDIPKFLHIFP
jgi:hypothetical protein